MKIDADLLQQLTAMAADDGLELLAAEVVGSGPSTVLRLVPVPVMTTPPLLPEMTFPSPLAPPPMVLS